MPQFTILHNFFNLFKLHYNLKTSKNQRTIKEYRFRKTNNGPCGTCIGSATFATVQLRHAAGQVGLQRRQRRRQHPMRQDQPWRRRRRPQVPRRQAQRGTQPVLERPEAPGPFEGEL